MPMKVIALTAALFATPLPVLAVQPSSADAEALAALAAEADLAWNRRDAPAMTGVYTPGASLIVGQMPAPREGQAQIGDYIVRAFAGRDGEFRHVTRLRRMEMVGPDLAVTDAVVDVDRRQPDGSWATVRRFDNVSVVERTAAGWRLRTVRAFPRP